MISNLCKNVAPLTLALGASTWVLRGYVPLPVTVVLAHTAGAGLAVSLAANNGVVEYTHGMLGKDPSSGQVSLLGYAVLWPYHLLLRARIWFKRRRSQEPLWNEVLPGWYLGGWPASEQQLPNGPLAELDVTTELPARVRGPYYNIPIYDTMAPTVHQTDAAVRWALQQSAQGSPLYVFCQNGHGRSGVVMCAALIAAGHASTWQQALEMVQSKRPKVKLNAAQQAALEAWAEAHAKSS